MAFSGFVSPAPEDDTLLTCTQRRRPRGDCHPKIWGGDGPCIRPPIFWEVVLSDARESTNRVKEGVVKEFFSEIVVVLVRKGSYRPTTFNIVKEPAWSKKRHSEILVREQFSVPPKLGARSPPLPISIKFDAVNSIYFYQDNVYCNHINCNSSNISRSIPSTIMVTTLIPDGRLFNCPLPW